MSGIAITREMLDEIEAVLARHAPESRDAHVRLHLLAGLAGFMVGERDMEAGEREAVLDGLRAFMDGVAEQRLAARRPSTEALGIWRPEENDR